MRNWGCGTYIFALLLFFGGLMWVFTNLAVGIGLWTVLALFFVKVPPRHGGWH